jgi:hypothetical protein
LYITIGAISTLLTISLIVNTVLFYRVRNQRIRSSSVSLDSQPQQYVNQVKMEETHGYVQLGIRNTDDYQKLSVIVAGGPPQETHVLDSNYSNVTLQE